MQAQAVLTRRLAQRALQGWAAMLAVRRSHLQLVMRDHEILALTLQVLAHLKAANPIEAQPSAAQNS